MRRIGLIILLALAAASCGPREGAQKQADTPLAAAPRAGASIGPDGAAGISTALAMDVEAVRAAAPAFNVAAVESQIDGQPFTAITLTAGGEEVFRVLPNPARTHVHAIITKSAQARGPTQDIVGRTLFGVAPPEQVPFCIAEFVDGAPGFACSTDAAGAFWRVYQLPEAYDGPSAAFEEIEPDVLHDSTLAEMRWVAPRAE